MTKYIFSCTSFSLRYTFNSVCVSPGHPSRWSCVSFPPARSVPHPKKREEKMTMTMIHIAGAIRSTDEDCEWENCCFSRAKAKTFSHTVAHRLGFFFGLTTVAIVSRWLSAKLETVQKPKLPWITDNSFCTCVVGGEQKKRSFSNSFSLSRFRLRERRRRQKTKVGVTRESH